MFPGSAHISCRSHGAWEKINMVGADFYKQAGPTDLRIGAARVLISRRPTERPGGTRGGVARLQSYTLGPALVRARVSRKPRT
jgi:hypothetical protein